MSQKQHVRRVKSLPFAELQIEMHVAFSQLQLNSKHYSTPGVTLHTKTKRLSQDLLKN